MRKSLFALASILILCCPVVSARQQEAESSDRDSARAAFSDLWDPVPRPAACTPPRLVEARPIPERRHAEMRRAGKVVTVDPLTGQAFYRHLSDFLPVGWGKSPAGSGPTDSFGNPIVNEVSGLPAWAERDVQALRDAIRSSISALSEKPPDRAEAERALGNYLGQALVRGLEVGDLVRLDSAVISPAVGGAIVAQLNFYENLKRARADDWGYKYRPSDYSERVVALIEAQGSFLAEVLKTEASSAIKATPSGCYATTTFTRGMTLMSGGTVPWRNSGEDDAAFDVAPGFLFYFYGCDDPDANSNVQVSTNGYVSFFEQGGGALDGLAFANVSIPSTEDPDGFVAAFWDDLWIAPAQGSTDQVGYVTQGAVGSRVFTVEWLSVSRVGGNTTDQASFQVKLIEATGDIELHFDTSWSDDSLTSATVGMEDYAGLDGDCGPNCDASNQGATIPSNYRFAPVRPANNDCSSLTRCLASDAAVVGTTLGASGADQSSCGFNDVHDVWFWYHAPVTGNVTFDTCLGTTLDTTLAVFDQCAGGIQLGCNDFACGQQSSVTVELTSGQDYYIRLAGYNGSQGTYRLEATPDNFAGGDTCAGAWGFDTSFPGFTTDNSGCVGDTSCGSDDVIDEWLTWVAPTSGKTRATTCSGDTTFDTTLAVFDGCGGTELACNDDNSLGALCSTLEWDAVGGTTYKIRVAGFNRGHGNYELIVSPPIFVDGFESGDTTAWSTSVGETP